MTSPKSKLVSEKGHEMAGSSDKKRPGVGGRPILLPGFWGPLAHAVGGVQKLADAIGVPVRNLRAWARNDRAYDALAASKLADLAAKHGIRPTLAEAPGGWVASTPRDGWVTFPDEPKGWDRRKRLVGFPAPEAKTGSVDLDEYAAVDGWPYTPKK